MKANAIDLISKEMTGDDADRNDQSERLVRVYNQAGPVEKKAIDDALICICGWSLRSIFEKLESGR
jgi:hypothetical protein